MRADAHVDAVAEAQVAFHPPRRVEALGIRELVLVAVRADEQEYDPLTGAHRLTRDLGVDEQRAADELERKVVAEHLLEGRRDRRRVLDQRRAAGPGPPQLVGAAGDDLRQGLRRRRRTT